MVSRRAMVTSSSAMAVPPGNVEFLKVFGETWGVLTAEEDKVAGTFSSKGASHLLTPSPLIGGPLFDNPAELRQRLLTIVNLQRRTTSLFNRRRRFSSLSPSRPIACRACRPRRWPASSAAISASTDVPDFLKCLNHRVDDAFAGENVSLGRAVHAALIPRPCGRLGSGVGRIGALGVHNGELTALLAPVGGTRIRIAVEHRLDDRGRRQARPQQRECLGSVAHIDNRLRRRDAQIGLAHNTPLPTENTRDCTAPPTSPGVGIVTKD